MKALFVFLVLLVKVTSSLHGDAVLLQNVQTLTLYRGRYTTARRSSPVPQLRCVGGSAGCQAFVPEVVQCQNRGWDGVDVQWECKTDMDNAYRFGFIEVSCEGYDHPSDAYILKGSCGLEYNLELTEEGRRKHAGSHRGFNAFEGFFSGSSGDNRKRSHHSSDSSDVGFSNLLVVAGLLLVAYCFYTFALKKDGYPGNQDYGSATAPPPPGFRPEFAGYSGANSGYGFHDDYTHKQRYPGQQSNFGGFWTGMGTGGMLGYLFGRQRSQYHANYGNTTSNNSSPSLSTGTRTASGYGGTKRR
ncbi:unnamed protein product [Tetraodon nigroviridis]|uniref:Store-operated calcium entry-associated regulatory factor n=1 Tax=Tetraodon nigroviridis TaxID=99883 RepID=Q4RKB9_TETNG|nr:unnamed protein product [Tetraodon nigroviridis]